MSEFVTAKVEIQETAATIGARREFLSPAIEAIKAARAEIERQIRRDRFFLTTFEPFVPTPDSSRVIRRMCEASAVANVGPMATVAGTIAQEALEAMIAAGCVHGWVDNGGDVAALLEERTTVEVFSEPGSKSAYALELDPTRAPIGVCTSSGRLGHSISLGNADLAVVIAKDAVLADALATAVANRVRSPDDLVNCFGEFASIPGMIGGLAMCNGSVATCGRIPKLIEVEHNPERMTVHSKMSSSKFIGHDQQRSEVRS